MANLGYPNVNGGSNYSDDELQYYFRDILKDYNNFIPTPVLRDAWRGARIREMQPREGSLSDGALELYLREALDTRLGLQDAPKGTLTPSGADAYKIWNSSLSPADVILRQTKLREQQEATKDYYPPIEY